MNTLRLDVLPGEPEPMDVDERERAETARIIDIAKCYGFIWQGKRWEYLDGTPIGTSPISTSLAYNQVTWDQPDYQPVTNRAFLWLNRFCDLWPFSKAKI